MTNERWKQIERLFESLCDLPPEERSRALNSLTDADLRREVESLLDGDRGHVTVAASMIQHEASLVSLPRIGPYRVTATIGHGGMGAVYRAERDDDQYRKQVAIKIVRRGLESEYAITRFRHERQILAALEHPNIARMLDGGSTQEGLPYLVMEYIEGVPITQFSCPMALKLRMFRQVCDAVQYAHRKLIIHRDIKPGNILVTADGTPKLLDFGIAKLLDPGLSPDALPETSTGLRMMTPEYASPEQMRGEPVSTATDVYSLGLVLRELTDGAAGELDAVARKAAHEDAERRYASVEQLSDDIARYQDGRPILARPDTFAYRAGKFLRRNRLAAAATVLVTFSVAGGVIATLWQARQTQERFDQVRNLANRFLFDFHDKIQNLPGSTEAREMVVKTALEYLDKLATRAKGDQQLQFELGVAYIKVGDAQGLPKQPNLGRPKDALASYRKAFAILARLKPDERVTRELGRCYLHIATVDHYIGDPDGEKAAIAKALAIGERDPMIGGLAYAALGDNEMAADRIPESLASYRKSLTLNRQVYEMAGSDETRRNVTVSLNGFGLAQMRAGDLEGALKSFEEGERLRRPDPNNTSDLRWMEILYQNIGNLLGDPDAPNLERLADAMSAYRKQFALAEQLYKADPGNATARLDMMRAYGKLATAQRDSNPRLALGYNMKALEMVGSLPEGVEKLFAVAALEDGRAYILKNLGRLEEAAAAIGRSIEAVRKMQGNTANNSSPEEAEQVAANDLGDIQLALGRKDAALHSYRLGLRAAESGIKGQEADIWANHALYYCYGRMAHYWALAGDGKQADEWSRKQAEVWRNWNVRFIPNPYSLRHARTAPASAQKKF